MNFNSIFNLLLVSVAFHLVSGEKNCQENEEEAKCVQNPKLSEESNQNSGVKKLSKNPYSSSSNHQSSKFQITTEQPSLPPNNEENDRRKVIQQGGGGESPDDEATAPDQRYPKPETERQNLFLSDDTGKYNVRLESVRSSKRPDFNRALGALSAHILNPRTDQEYIPYPPNGDPYNYLAYRGHPQTTEPPVVRAYEAATNYNYGSHPSANFAHYTTNGVFPNDAYRRGFQSQFDNFEAGFYRNPTNIFDQGGFYSTVQRDLEPIFDGKYYFDEGRPVKRFA